MKVGGGDGIGERNVESEEACTAAEQDAAAIGQREAVGNGEARRGDYTSPVKVKTKHDDRVLSINLTEPSGNRTLCVNIPASCRKTFKSIVKRAFGHWDIRCDVGDFAYAVPRRKKLVKLSDVAAACLWDGDLIRCLALSPHFDGAEKK